MDVDGLAKRLPYESFVKWHTYFQHKDREADKRLLPILAMQYNTSLLIASSLGGAKIDESDFKTPEDFLEGSSRRKRRNSQKLSAEDSLARARARYG